MQARLSAPFIWVLGCCLFVVLAAVPQASYGQAGSAQGVSTGGNVIEAAVPQAGNLFTVIDVMQDLQREVADCAQQGLLYDSANGTCRNGVPPEVTFTQDSTETTVEVQNPYPNHLTSQTYGNLDGADGIAALIDKGDPLPPVNNDPPAEDPPAEDPPANDPPAEEAPAEDPPAEEAPANDPPEPAPEPETTTGPWTTSSWSACSEKCNGGVRTRDVSCNYDICTGSEPASTQSCNTQSCVWVNFSRDLGGDGDGDCHFPSNPRCPSGVRFWDNGRTSVACTPYGAGCKIEQSITNEGMSCSEFRCKE